MYKIPKYMKSTLTSVETTEGEPIELKVERIQNNKEPIKDGAPEIFTERSEGVLAGYNIRTDRWEVAADAMDYISKKKTAERESKAKKADVEVEAIKESGDGKTESIQGKNDAK